MKKLGGIVAAIILASAPATPSLAVEGGLGAYLPGSRDSFAGIVPGPGFYASVDVVHSDGSVQGLSLAGLPIRADADLRLTFTKFSFTKVFDATVFGGVFGLNLNIPFVNSAKLSFVGQIPPIAGMQINDKTSGLGDTTITPMIGWNKGKLNYSAAFSICAPTGSYDVATLDLANGTLNALNTGKNIWSFQPVISATWFDPASGWEYSGAASLLFSTRNNATDYQNAPALTLEGAVLKHSKTGWGYGLSGYVYQQLADDTGAGAESTRVALGASSLKASVFGVGPMVTYSGIDVFGKSLSLKLKYYSEFGAKRRFESDTVWLNLALTF